MTLVASGDSVKNRDSSRVDDSSHAITRQNRVIMSDYGAWSLLLLSATVWSLGTYILCRNVYINYFICLFIADTKSIVWTHTLCRTQVDKTDNTERSTRHWSRRNTGLQTLFATAYCAVPAVYLCSATILLWFLINLINDELFMMLLFLLRRPTHAPWLIFILSACLWKCTR